MYQFDTTKSDAKWSNQWMESIGMVTTEYPGSAQTDSKSASVYWLTRSEKAVDWVREVLTEWERCWLGLGDLLYEIRWQVSAPEKIVVTRSRGAAQRQHQVRARTQTVPDVIHSLWRGGDQRWSQRRFGLAVCVTQASFSMESWIQLRAEWSRRSPPVPRAPIHPWALSAHEVMHDLMTWSRGSLRDNSHDDAQSNAPDACWLRLNHKTFCGLVCRPMSSPSTWWAPRERSDADQRINRRSWNGGGFALFLVCTVIITNDWFHHETFMYDIIRDLWLWLLWLLKSQSSQPDVRVWRFQTADFDGRASGGRRSRHAHGCCAARLQS